MLTPQLLLLQPAVRLYVPTPRPQSPPQPAIPATWTPSLQLDCLDEDVLPDVFSMLPHFADLSTFMIQQVINFAKEIPAFRSVGRHLQETPAAAPALMPPLAHPPRSGRSLPIDDQISLLKGATLEICQIQFNTVFNTETNAWECGQHCYTIQDGALGKGGREWWHLEAGDSHVPILARPLPPRSPQLVSSRSTWSHCSSSTSA